MKEPKIILTGDVHHMSLKTDDQRYINSTEAELALEAAQIALKYDVKVTYFITGRTVMEEPDVIRTIAKMPNTELGGHTYYAFKPKWLYNLIFNRLVGLSNGVSVYQNWEIKKTMNVFAKKLDVQIESWRDHAYRHDRNTFSLLYKNGISIVSDEVDPNQFFPVWLDNGIISLPVNIMPDHDHVYHGNLTPENTKNYSLGRSQFPSKLYQPCQWFELIQQQIQKVAGKEGIAILLIHPACVYLMDEFEIYEELCKLLGNFETLTVSQAKTLIENTMNPK